MRANYGDLQHSGQVIYLAVNKEEPAGKPLKECRLVTVKLTLSAKEDRKILRERGLIALIFFSFICITMGFTYVSRITCKHCP
ncbi:MAG: DUF1670 domain-containing protein [Theionarchaea archaeon]|nr:DUF1670 domain-containing protein [Theionarchaea archaeon]